jgi:hypothetical protein
VKLLALPRASAEATPSHAWDAQADGSSCVPKPGNRSSLLRALERTPGLARAPS